MYKCIENGSDAVVYTLEREKRYEQGNTVVGVLPQSIHYSKYGKCVSCYNYTVSRNGQEVENAMLELSGKGVKSMARAMQMARTLIDCSNKLQPYSAVLQNFSQDREKNKFFNFGPYATLTSSSSKKNLYNVLNLTEPGRLENINWVMSSSRYKGTATPVLYSYKAARMTDRARRNANLVDAVLPDPLTGKIKGGIRIRCTKEELKELVKKLQSTPELSWAALSLKKSVKAVGPEEKEMNNRTIGARVRTLEDEYRGRKKY